jgi:hypothetical protein
MEAAGAVTDDEVLSGEEVLDALDAQEQAEAAIQGASGYRFKRLKHLELALNGDCIGTVIALGGVPNTGKCQVAGTLLNLPDGSMESIESLYQRKAPQVLTMNEDLSIGLANVVGWYDSGEIQTIKTTLKSGLSIETSTTHPFYTLNGWIKASELKQGDYIASVRDYPVYANLNSSLSRPQLFVLACLLAEGGLNGNMVKMTNADSEIRNQYKAFLQELFPGVAFREEGPNGITIIVRDPTTAGNRV